MNPSTDNPFYDPSLTKRHFKAKLFKGFTIASIIFSISFLVFFLGDMVYKGLPAFQQSYIQIEVEYNEKTIKSTRKAIDRKYRKVVSRAWLRDIPKRVKAQPKLMNTTQITWVLLNHQVDQYLKGHYYKVKDTDLKLIKQMQVEGKVEQHFNRIFFTHGD
ncbi:MAG: DUF3333 domain-containing protein, partial [Methyloprofundus sp.]|nr:DUF3333 domain-containing protein [Methyloprofundus sp.]